VSRLADGVERLLSEHEFDAVLGDLFAHSEPELTGDHLVGQSQTLH
jgi:hypothetical protein